MKKIVCNGCGMSEAADAPKHKINEVTLVISNGSRDWEGNTEYTADLCPDCVGKQLHNYFGISAEGTLSIPAFIEKSHLKAV